MIQSFYSCILELGAPLISILLWAHILFLSKFVFSFPFIFVQGLSRIMQINSKVIVLIWYVKNFGFSSFCKFIKKLSPNHLCWTSGALPVNTGGLFWSLTVDKAFLSIKGSAENIKGEKILTLALRSVWKTMKRMAFLWNCFRKLGFCLKGRNEF